MNLIAPLKQFSQLFQTWISTSIHADRFLMFRQIFVGIWILYDAIDISFQGVIRGAWTIRDDQLIFYYITLQIALIIAQTGLFLGILPRFFALLCLIFRGTIAYVWPLNDFLFYCIIMAILTQCKVEMPPKQNNAAPSHVQNRVLRWPVDLLIAQTAWVYFATAFLKISPLWLSGGGLYVRIQDAKMHLGLQYPPLIENLLTNLSWLSILAKIAVIGELTISYLLVYCLTNQTKENNALRYLLCGLTICVHTFAALTTNVFFFGAVMIATVLVFNLPERHDTTNNDKRIL